MFPDIIGALFDDATLWRHPTSLRVYRHLARNHPLIYHEPQEIKSWFLAQQLRTNRQRVQKSLELLIRRGFVIECGRAKNGVRSLMLARDKRVMNQNGTA